MKSPRRLSIKVNSRRNHTWNMPKQIFKDKNPPFLSCLHRNNFQGAFKVGALCRNSSDKIECVPGKAFVFYSKILK